MAADGTGDRPLFDRLPAGCDAPGHVSLSPVDENILVLQCNPKSGPTRLMVMTIEGDLVRNLPTGHVSVDDPSISPDGRTVAFWASDVTTGPTGGSIYTVGIEDTADPVALTERPAGSDADPAWSPDGESIAVPSERRGRQLGHLPDGLGRQQRTTLRHRSEPRPQADVVTRRPPTDDDLEPGRQGSIRRHPSICIC